MCFISENLMVRIIGELGGIGFTVDKTGRNCRSLPSGVAWGVWTTLGDTYRGVMPLLAKT